MTSETWLPMLLVTGAYLAMFGVGELARDRWSASVWLTRKFSHVGAGCIALALPWLFGSPGPVVFLAGSFLVFMVVTSRTGWLGSVHAIERRSAGAFLYPVSLAVVFVIAADDYPRYVIAILALALGDASGAIAGSRWGRHGYAAWGQAKTWEGSSVVFAVLGVVCGSILALSGLPLVAACLVGSFVGLVVAVVEGALPWGLDNLGVPLAALVALETAGSAGSSATLLLGVAALFALALAFPFRRGDRRPGRHAWREVTPDVR
jgi:dolichol kinase